MRTQLRDLNSAATVSNETADAAQTPADEQPPYGSALADAQELVDMAGDVRSRLQSERAALAAQIDKIDVMLARLPAIVPTTPMQSSPHVTAALSAGRSVPGAKTIPGLLYKIIFATPGLDSKEITEAAQR